MADVWECLGIIRELYLAPWARSNPELRKWPAGASGVIVYLEPWN